MGAQQTRAAPAHDAKRLVSQVRLQRQQESMGNTIAMVYQCIYSILADMVPEIAWDAWESIGIPVILPLPQARAKPFKNLAKINILLPKSAAGRGHSLTSPGRHGRSL